MLQHNRNTFTAPSDPFFTLHTFRFFNKIFHPLQTHNMEHSKEIYRNLQLLRILLIDRRCWKGLYTLPTMSDDDVSPESVHFLPFPNPLRWYLWSHIRHQHGTRLRAPSRKESRGKVWDEALRHAPSSVCWYLRVAWCQRTFRLEKSFSVSFNEVRMLFALLNPITERRTLDRPCDRPFWKWISHEIFIVN